MSHKESLVTAALLGTEQQAVPELPATGQLAHSLSLLQDACQKLGRERTLLHASAILCLVEKSGRRFTKYEGELLSPSQPEEKTLVSSAAAGHLKSLLDSNQDLLPEWLQITSQLQKRVPDDCLIGILQMGSQNESLAELVAACVGKKASWLSQFNSEWAFVEKQGTASGTSIDELQKSYDFGSALERAWALREMRRLDPARALELMCSTWKTDGAEDRAGFLAALETGLSMADEPFLETEALDDKRKEVRLQARELLLSLPLSRLSQRAEERAFACLCLEQEKGSFLNNLLAQNKKKAQLLVTVPETCAKNMQRDGIVAKTPDSRLGEKAWWLSQIIEQVNPRRIMQHLKVTEPQLLELISSSEWQRALRRGLAEAVVRYHDRQLARLLLQAEQVENIENLFALLDSAEQESVVTQSLEERGFILLRPIQNNYDSGTLNLLMRMQHLWSYNFSKVILKTLRTHITQKNNYIFMDYITRHLGTHMDVELWASVEDTWRSTADQDPTVERMMSILSFRKEMRDALIKEH